MKTEMQGPQPALLQSAREYEHVLDFLRTVDEEIGTASPARLLEINQSLAELQGRAAQADRLLLAQTGNQTPQEGPIHPLVENRERLIRDILLLNERIRAKASGVKSHLAFELGKLRNGRSAMHGYKQQQNDQGRIVNRSS